MLGCQQFISWFGKIIRNIYITPPNSYSVSQISCSRNVFVKNLSRHSRGSYDLIFTSKLFLYLSSKFYSSIPLVINGWYLMYSILFIKIMQFYVCECACQNTSVPWTKLPLFAYNFYFYDRYLMNWYKAVTIDAIIIFFSFIKTYGDENIESTPKRKFENTFFISRRFQIDTTSDICQKVGQPF